MTAPSTPPSREEIAQRAQQIWRERDCPADRDVEIWLEAEQQLSKKLLERDQRPVGQSTEPADPRSKPVPSTAEQLEAETAAEGVVEYSISPAVSDEEVVKAVLQKNERSLSKRPAKTSRRDKMK